MATKSIIPTNKPRISDAEVYKLLSRYNLDASKEVIFIGIRGYYADTFGAPRKNDRTYYDDALVLVGPNGVTKWNFNMDPGGYGHNPNAQPGPKGFANLQDGKVWTYQIGKHKGYDAFRQGANVTVVRDAFRLAGKDYPVLIESGQFGINIHRGSWHRVSSEGCQTLPPNQWDAFQPLAYAWLKSNGQKKFPYLVVTREEVAGL